MLSLSLPENSTAFAGGLRPVNLRTDLAPLADLIELSFSDTMDHNGRAAVREMRTLSRIGPGLNVLAGVSDLTQGINLGYVWITDGKLVGNVSVYPANLPASFGSVWIIANVAVHPDYRGHGIASRLMTASMNMLRHRGGTAVVLQVEQLNETARHLYEKLGFGVERVWTTWRRPAGLRMPPPFDHAGRAFDITHPRRGEWRAEFALAQRVRPQSLGGLGWLRPLHKGAISKTPWKRLVAWVSLSSDEHLVIRSPVDAGRLDAALWIETSFAAPSARLTLMVEPEYQNVYDDALLNLAVRRLGAHQPIVVEHPDDDTFATRAIQSYGFRPQRTLAHMRWEPNR